MPRALLCPPTYFEVCDVKNPYMHKSLGIDHAKAHAQWEELQQALADAGVEVETIAPVPDLEDMVFAANQVFVGHHPTLGKFIVPSEMRYASRQREVPFYVEWFEKRGYKVIAIDLYGECLEGHGDLIWHPDRSRIWAGYGFRSTKPAIEKLAEAMAPLGFPVTPLELVDSYCYHLDTSLCPLNHDAVLLYPGAFSTEALAEIRAGFDRVHEITRDEALAFIGNGIVAGGRYITPHLTPNLEAALRSEGLTPVVIDTSEFEKSGGSAFCMKCFVE
jgi:N-dimethylarginine dimethylaminohydrolase